MLLGGKSPPQDGHRYVVGAVEVSPELLLQVFMGVERQEVVEPFLIVTAASLNLSVMPWCPRPDQLVPDVIDAAEDVQGMNALRLGNVREFRTVIGLENGRRISKVCDRPLHEVDRGIAALFPVRVQEALS